MPKTLEGTNKDADKQMGTGSKDKTGPDGGGGGKPSKSAKAGGGKTAGSSSNGKNVDSIRKNSEMKALLTLMLKTQLRGEQRLREVEGALFDTYVGPADCQMLNHITQQTQAYNSKAQGNKNHGLGPPHVYAFLGFLEGIEKNHKEKVGGGIGRYWKSGRRNWRRRSARRWRIRFACSN